MTERQRLSDDTSHAERVTAVLTRVDSALMEHADGIFEDLAYIQTLQEKGVFHRIAFLLEKAGVHSTVDPDTCTSPDTAKIFARQVHQAFVSASMDWLKEQQAIGTEIPSSEYQALESAHKLLLVAGNIVRPSVWQDWRVERHDSDLSDRLGLKCSLQDVERRLQEKYGQCQDRCVHVVKGAGDGRTLREWERFGDPSWVRIGVGDRLYYDISAVLMTFVRKDLQNSDAVRVQTIVEVLTYAVQRRLRAEWSDHLRQRQPHPNGPKGALSAPYFFDANRIFSLLKDPALLDGIQELGHVLHAEEFVDDSARMELLDIATQKWLARYSGHTHPGSLLEGTTIAAFREKHLAKLWKWRHEVEALFSGIRQNEFAEDHVPELLQKWHAWTGKRIPDEQTLSVARRLYRKLLGDINDTITAVLERGQSPIAASGEPSRKKVRASLPDFSHYFTQQFAQAVKHADLYEKRQYYKQLPENAPDLNAAAVYSSHHLVPKYFVDIPAALGPDAEGQVTLISSVRSDSHEPEAEWHTDIQQNLSLLQPGGILLTDGHRESYTRFIRIPDPPKHFRQWWVISRVTREPLALLVQRKPADVAEWITEDVSALFIDSVDLVEPHKVMEHRRDLRIVDDVRRRVFDTVLHGQREGFTGLHEIIVHETRQRLLFAQCLGVLKEKEDTLAATKTIIGEVQRHVRRTIEETLAAHALQHSADEWPEKEKEVTAFVRQYLGTPDVVLQQKDYHRLKEELESDVFDNVRRWFARKFGGKENKEEGRALHVAETYATGIVHALQEAVRRLYLKQEEPEEGRRRIQQVAEGRLRLKKLPYTIPLEKEKAIADDVVAHVSRFVSRKRKAR